jgi:ParB family transcriptional regulator, chromosome partitioning protein
MELTTPFASELERQEAAEKEVALLTQHATYRVARFGSTVRSKLNVRKKDTDISELKALIAAQGLLQNLIGYMQVVDGNATGIVEIVAGGRRLSAIGKLIQEGIFPEDYGILYLEVTEEEAIAISIAENRGRVDMHPADLYEAMMELTVRGKSVDDIALMYRLDPQMVKKCLKLANVSPPLLELYRDDKANLDQMQALAITEDHATQEMAWNSLPDYNRSARELRRLLTAQQVNIRSDRLARYVGAEAFEKAGGVITRDFFSGQDDGYISDLPLLEKLAMAKLEKKRAKLQKEGFGWVDLLPRADHSEISAYGTVRAKLSPLTDEQQQRASELNGKIEVLEEALEALGDDGDDAEYERLDTECGSLRAELATIQRSRVMVQNADDKALAGAVLTLDDFGNVVVKRDVIRPADKIKMVKLTESVQGEDEPSKSKPVHSDRLTHELTSQRTAALQAEMMDQSDIALVYLTYTLMREVLMKYSHGTLAKIRISKPTLAEVAQSSPAAQAFNQRREQLLARLPDDDVGGGWLQWLTTQSVPVVLEMMAFCVASTLDATQQREAASPQFVTLAQGLKLDMSKWWKATASSYFGSVSKDRIAEVVTEAVSPEAAIPLEKMKKGAAAEAAERAVADTAWLPEALRAN